VRRDAYAAVGGFKSAFGCFAESLLAAELHAGGYRLGYAPAAAVKHYNSTDLRDLVAYVNEYRAGEAAFRRSADAARFAPYFGWSDAGNTGRILDRPLAGRYRWLRAKAAYLWARAQFALPARNAEQRYQRFCRLWARMSDAAAARAEIQNGSRRSRASPR
jgi:GT2 family glycosyltransferase